MEDLAKLSRLDSATFNNHDYHRALLVSTALLKGTPHAVLEQSLSNLPSSISAQSRRPKWLTSNSPAAAQLSTSSAIHLEPLHYWDIKTAQRILRHGDVSLAELNVLLLENGFESLRGPLTPDGEFPKYGGLNQISALHRQANFVAHPKLLDALRPLLPTRTVNNKELITAQAALNSGTHTLRQLDEYAVKAGLEPVSHYVDENGNLTASGRGVRNQDLKYRSLEGAASLTNALVRGSILAIGETYSANRIAKRQADPNRIEDGLFRQMSEHG